MSVIRNLFKLAQLLMNTDDSEDYPQVQAQYLDKTCDVHQINQYGFTSRAPEMDSLMFTWSIQGQEQNRAAIITTPTLRFRNLKSGESVQENMLTLAFMFMKEDGSIYTETNEDIGSKIIMDVDQRIEILTHPDDVGSNILMNPEGDIISTTGIPLDTGVVVTQQNDGHYIIESNIGGGLIGYLDFVNDGQIELAANTDLGQMMTFNTSQEIIIKTHDSVGSVQTFNSAGDVIIETNTATGTFEEAGKIELTNGTATGTWEPSGEIVLENPIASMTMASDGTVTTTNGTTTIDQAIDGTVTIEGAGGLNSITLNNDGSISIVAPLGIDITGVGLTMNGTNISDTHIHGGVTSGNAVTSTPI